MANGAELTNEVLAMIGSAVSTAKTDGEQVVASPKPQMLTSVSSPTPTGEPIAIEHPQTPLAQTSLLTNAPKEPTLLSELQSELDSADEVDIIGAFITFSGIRHLTQSLKRVTPASDQWQSPGDYRTTFQLIGTSTIGRLWRSRQGEL